MHLMHIKKILHFHIDMQCLEPLTIYPNSVIFFIQTPEHVHLQAGLFMCFLTPYMTSLLFVSLN